MNLIVNLKPDLIQRMLILLPNTIYNPMIADLIINMFLDLLQDLIPNLIYSNFFYEVQCFSNQYKQSKMASF